MNLKYYINLIKAHKEKYHWVGVYLKKGDKLHLYPYYIGRPTPHEVIPLDKGICGAAVREETIINVPNVNEDPRYLACSIHTRSEIVVPIRNRDGKIIGEIDIDSDEPNAFNHEDEAFLEGMANIIGEMLSQ